jgi:transposase
MMFEGRVILALLACKTVSGANDLVRITWDEAHGIMTRAVSRGLMRREEVEMPYLAAGEKSYGRGGKKFVTILMDLKRGVVHGTALGRSTSKTQLASTVSP